MRQSELESLCVNRAFTNTNTPDRSLMEAGSGNISIEKYTVFPGIWIETIEAYAPSFCLCHAYSNRCIRITHCGKGCLEYEGPDRVLSLHQGDLVIYPCVCQSPKLNCPLGYYYGLSITLDLEAAPQCASCLLADVEIDLPLLFQRLLPGGAPFLLRATAQLKHVFSELYDVPPSLKKGYYKVKTLELLLFLSRFDPGMSETEEHISSQSEAALVKQVFAFVSEHRSSHITTQELAQRFHVSPGLLRRSMGKMYGKPLYQCIRSFKMHLAARELLASTRTVADIAGEFGYDNSSKFACAFQAVMGCSPGAYRANAGGGQAVAGSLERKTLILE